MKSNIQLQATSTQVLDQEKLSTNQFASLVYNLLVKTSWLDNHRYTSRLWQKVWQKTCSIFSGSINTKVHNYKTTLNYGYLYPVFSRKFSSYNNPLVELAYQAYKSKDSKITLIDVGAAIGDTILLVYSNCPNMVESFYCIDGDREFFRYLQKNLEGFEEGTLILSMLSHIEKNEKELIRTHRGTASAQGELEVPARPLDSVMKEANLKGVDVLKIDVDGFDGKVILGAKDLLSKHKPAVIFEWHPILCERTGNSYSEHFEGLESCGYRQFIWFSKFGDFSHIMTGFNKESVDKLAEICLRNQLCYDWHYDVIALHHDSLINPVELAELSFAKARKSKF